MAVCVCVLLEKRGWKTKNKWPNLKITEWCFDRSRLEDPPRAAWAWSWRPDRCSRCSSYRCRSHSCLHSVWPAGIEGRRRRWWPSAPRAGLRSSCEECSCTAWHRHRDGSDQLDSEGRKWKCLISFRYAHVSALLWCFWTSQRLLRMVTWCLACSVICFSLYLTLLNVEIWPFFFLHLSCYGNFSFFISIHIKTSVSHQLVIGEVTTV